LEGDDQSQWDEDDERDENGEQADDDLAHSRVGGCGSENANDQEQPQHGVLWSSRYRELISIESAPADSSLGAHV
jgi:hypothetical protein